MPDLLASFQINPALPALAVDVPLRAAPVSLPGSAVPVLDFGTAIAALLAPVTKAAGSEKRQDPAERGKALPDRDEPVPDGLTVWVPGAVAVTPEVAAMPEVAAPTDATLRTGTRADLPTGDLARAGQVDQAIPADSTMKPAEPAAAIGDIAPQPQARSAASSPAAVADEVPSAQMLASTPLATQDGSQAARIAVDRDIARPASQPILLPPSFARQAMPANVPPIMTLPAARPAEEAATAGLPRSSELDRPMPKVMPVSLSATSAIAEQQIVREAALAVTTAAPAPATIAPQQPLLASTPSAAPQPLPIPAPAGPLQPVVAVSSGAAPFAGPAEAPRSNFADMPTNDAAATPHSRFAFAAKGRVAPGPVPLVTLQPPIAAPTMITNGAAAQVFATALSAAAIDPQRAEPVADAALLLAAGAPAEQRQMVQAMSAASNGTLDLAQDDWPAQMIDRIAALRDATEAADTRIKLAPENLGALEVSIRRDGDRIHVHFTADNPAARQLIADAAPRLAELADARGVKLGQTSIDGGSQQGAQRDTQHQQQSQSPARNTSVATRGEPTTDERIA